MTNRPYNRDGTGDIADDHEKATGVQPSPSIPLPQGEGPLAREFFSPYSTGEKGLLTEGPTG